MADSNTDMTESEIARQLVAAREIVAFAEEHAENAPQPPYTVELAVLLIEIAGKSFGVARALIHLSDRVGELEREKDDLCQDNTSLVGISTDGVNRAAELEGQVIAERNGGIAEKVRADLLQMQVEKLNCEKATEIGRAMDAEERAASLVSENRRLREALEDVVRNVEDWCRQVDEVGTSWDDWDHCYKHFHYHGGLDEARAVLQDTAQREG